MLNFMPREFLVGVRRRAHDQDHAQQSSTFYIQLRDGLPQNKQLEIKPPYIEIIPFHASTVLGAA